MYCICCKKNIVFPALDSENEIDILWSKESIYDIHTRTIENGIIRIIPATYGSNHDGSQFIIAICDDCISKNIDEGILLFCGNYLVPSAGIEDIEKSKKIYQRKKNLDEIV